MSKIRNHIEKAIDELPGYGAPDYVWEQIVSEMDREQGTAHLDKAITEYNTEKQAPDSIWTKIETELVENESLRKAIANLPTYEAPDLFEKTLEAQKPKQINLTQRLYWVSGIAASLLLVAVTYFSSIGENVVMSSYTETISENNAVVKAAIEQLDEHDEILQVIEVHCAQIALQCQSPEFKGLFDYYLELDASKDELVAVMNDNQEQVQLVNYLVRVEKEKDEVGKQLIQMIIG